MVSGVVMSVLIIGIAALGFGVSVPQILSALLTAFVIDTALTYRKSGKLIWPASGLNTATGIALIMRVVGTESGDLWSWNGWYLYALVVAFALFSKYLIHYRGSHVFNPSNLALVLIFVLLGSGRVEPLDFWWAPLRGWMVVVYIIIIAGGTFTLARLRLLLIPMTFWLGLVAGLGLLASSGHCFSARWSLQPVCGTAFWWVVITSPEMLFFLFFMITDPKTIPRSGLARIVYALGIAAVATLLIAPQTTEFGAKVGLLAGLAVMSPLRWLLDRWLPDGSSEQSRLAQFVGRFAATGGTAVAPRTFLRGALGGAVVAAVAILVVAFGTPARQPAQAATAIQVPQVNVDVDPATLPAVTVDPEVYTLNSDVSDPAGLALTLAKNLEVEAQAMHRGEATLLLAADFGLRLEAMQGRMAQSVATGEWNVDHYSFDSLYLTTHTALGGQGTDLAFEATGTVETRTFNADGVQLGDTSVPFSGKFVMRQAIDDRWLIIDEIPEP
jgi:hypothetical protein